MLRFRRGTGGWKRGTLLAMFALLAGAQGAHASTVPCATLTNLQQYLDAADGCTIGNVLFDFYTGTGGSGLYAYVQFGSLGDVPAADVNVTVNGDGNSPNSAFGFTFATQTTADPLTGKVPVWEACYNYNGCDDNGQTPDLSLNFTAQLQNVPATTYFNSTTLSLDLAVGTAGYDGTTGFQGGETVYNANNSATLGNTTLAVGSDTDPTSASIDLPGQNQYIFLNKDLALFAASPGDAGQIVSFTEEFNYVNAPEPTAALLAGLGILGLAAIRWRKRLAAPLACVAVAAGMCGSAQATPACTTTTLANLLGTSCMVNDVLFTFVNYTDTMSPSGTPPIGADASNILVSPLMTPFNPGFNIVPNATVLSTSTLNMTLQITAQSTVNPITDIASGITGSANCLGSVCGSVGGSVTATAAGVNIPYTETRNGNTYTAAGGLQNTAPTPLPLTTTVTIYDVVTLTGGGTIFNLAHVSDLLLNLSEAPGTPVAAPEPMSFLIIGGGLVLLACGARKVRSGRGQKTGV